jgi:putative phosphoribosyl transferase
MGNAATPRALTTRETSVTVPAGSVTLDGTLAIPDSADGVILFAHGSGSSRHSPRNRYVAEELRFAGFGTLLLDLLTPAEEAIDDETRELRFDIGFLADRLLAAMRWLSVENATRALSLGLFGASTGAGAALVAAAREPGRVSGVVSRGGRPDLAGAELPNVQAPTLLIVGSRDEPVIELNERARAQMTAPVELVIVRRATHLFEEPGTLEEVARLARGWFVRHLRGSRGTL